MASEPAPDQLYRRQRLQELLEHEDFGGTRSALGALIGLKSGAFIRQMLEGDRPITEKTIAKFEAAKAGRYKGWFTDRAEADDFSLQAAQALQAISGSPKLRERALAYLQGLADLAAGSQSGGASPDRPHHNPTHQKAA